MPTFIFQVHVAIRPLLLQLGDYRTLNLNVIQRLSFLTQLFPNTFNEKLCEQLLAHLRKWLEVVILSHAQKGLFLFKFICKYSLIWNHVMTWSNFGIKLALGAQRSTSSEMKICIAIINIFHQIPAASHKVIEPLASLTLRAEKALMQEAGSSFRAPLLKFLTRYPSQTIDFLFNDSNIRDQHGNRFVLVSWIIF